MHVLVFPTEMWNADISSVTLLKRDFTIETFQVVLKILGTLVENICRGVSFQFKTNSIKDVFLEVFKTANFQNNSFCERPLKRVWNNFYLKRLILDSNSATLIKWLIIDLYLANVTEHSDLYLANVAEHSQEAFLLESVFVEVRNSGLYACNVREEGRICKDFLKFSNFLSFLSTSRKVSMG